MEWNGDGVGEVTNHTHAAAAPSLTPSLKAQEKKGKHFYVFPVKSEVEITMQLQGERERAAQGEEGRKRERKRERATIITLFLSTRRGQGGGTIDCFPHVRPGEQPLPPFSHSSSPASAVVASCCVLRWTGGQASC